MLLHGIFNSSIKGIIVVDANGIIIKANLASEQLFGYKTSKPIYLK